MRTVFSYVIIGITLRIFLSKSTWSIENNSTLMSTKIVHFFYWLKNMTARSGVCFSYMERFATNLLVKILPGQIVSGISSKCQTD